MPLSKGDLPNTPIVARFVPTPLQSGVCPKSFDELANWLAESKIMFDFSRIGFGYSAGTVDTATPDDRALPRFLFDNQDRYIGLAIWSVILGAWTIGNTIGELKTVVRSETVMQDELLVKGFVGTGWYLADGTKAGVPNLTSNTGFFTGASPNWDIYTVCYLGA